MEQHNNTLETLGTIALATAVVAILFKAFQQARETGVPVLVEEKGALYEIYPDGQKRFLRMLPPRPVIDIPQKFTLRR